MQYISFLPLYVDLLTTLTTRTTFNDCMCTYTHTHTQTHSKEKVDASMPGTSIKFSLCDFC